MNESDYSMTSVEASDDIVTDSSDVLSLLLTIEQLYAASNNVINSHSVTAVLCSMTIELQMLLIKLGVMQERWAVHLPFKEACSVDFKAWSSKAAQMAENITCSKQPNMTSASSIPSCHCLIDLFEQAELYSADCQDEISFGVVADIKQMLNRRHTVLDTLKQQRDECVDAITKMVISQLSSKFPIDYTLLSDLASAKQICASLLLELSAQLQQIHDQLVKLFSEQEYERLADRILLEPEYGGSKARREAREAVVNWRNGVPLKNLVEERKEQIEHVKEEIRKTRHGVKLEQYVNFDDDFQKQRSEFGRFLFHRRREISRDELYQLILLVYSIYYYQQDAFQSTANLVKEKGVESGDAPTPELPTDFRQSLRDNRTAVSLLLKALSKIEPYINGGKPVDGNPELAARYKDWSWCHLQTAFEKLAFLPQNSNKASFARFIHSLFPNRTEDSVKRSLYRNTNTNSPNIVADIVKEFESVRSLITNIAK